VAAGEIAVVPGVGPVGACAPPSLPTPARPYLCAMDVSSLEGSTVNFSAVKNIPDIGPLFRCDGTEAGVFFCQITPPSGVDLVGVGIGLVAIDADGSLGLCDLPGFQNFICAPATPTP